MQPKSRISCHGDWAVNLGSSPRWAWGAVSARCYLYRCRSAPSGYVPCGSPLAAWQVGPAGNGALGSLFMIVWEGTALESCGPDCTKRSHHRWSVKHCHHKTSASCGLSTGSRALSRYCGFQTAAMLWVKVTISLASPARLEAPSHRHGTGWYGATGSLWPCYWKHYSCTVEPLGFLIEY